MPFGVRRPKRGDDGAQGGVVIQAASRRQLLEPDRQTVAIEGVLLQRLVFAQELDRDRPALEARILRTPHLAHGPGTEAVDELIAGRDDDVLGELHSANAR